MPHPYDVHDQDAPSPLPASIAVMQEVLAERARSIVDEGYNLARHDVRLSQALSNIATKLWPLSGEPDGVKYRRRDLIRIAVRIIAEIERLDRAAARKPEAIAS